MCGEDRAFREKLVPLWLTDFCGQIFADKRSLLKLEQIFIVSLMSGMLPSNLLLACFTSWPYFWLWTSFCLSANVCPQISI